MYREDSINLDCAAHHPIVDEEVFKILRREMTLSGNPNSGHALGYASSNLIESAKDAFMRAIGAESGVVIITWSATLANHIVADLAGGNIACGPFEHPSIDHHDGKTPSSLVRELCDFSWPERRSHQHPLLVVASPCDGVTGVVQPPFLRRSESTLVMCDVTQAIGKLDISHISELSQVVTAGLHKFGGPRGIAFAWFSEEATVLLGEHKIIGMVKGAHGTPSTPLAAAAKHVLDSAVAKYETRPMEPIGDWIGVAKRRDELKERLAEGGCGIVAPDLCQTLPGHLYISLQIDAPAGFAVDHLGQRGIYVSQGTACSGDVDAYDWITDHKCRLRLSLGVDSLASGEMDRVVRAVLETRDLLKGWL